MAQQRIKFVRNAPNNDFTVTVEADTNTLTAQPVTLDAAEEFRLIIPDTLISKNDIAERVQAFIATLRDGQEILDAVLA